MAIMHSRVFSFFTQENAGAAAARSKHLRNSWSDLTHHFTFWEPGRANALAVKTHGCQFGLKM